MQWLDCQVVEQGMAWRWEGFKVCSSKYDRFFQFWSLSSIMTTIYLFHRTGLPTRV